VKIRIIPIKIVNTPTLININLRSVFFDISSKTIYPMINPIDDIMPSYGKLYE